MISILTLRCAGAVYAIDAEAVLEVVELPALSGWPGAPVGVAGVIDYRGQIIAVLDVALRLGAASLPLLETDQLIVVRIDGKGTKAALLVEEALELRSISAWRPLPAETPSSMRHASAFLLGVTTLEEQVVLALDLSTLIDFPLALPAGKAPKASPNRGGSEGLMAQRARELAVPLVRPNEDEHQSLVVVRLSGERLGIPVAEVAELASCPPFTPVPGAPAHLLGLAYLRGGLLRLVDIRAMLGLEHGGPIPSEVVVLSGPGMPTGLVVDSIESVTAVMASAGKFAFEDGWMTVLDTGRLDVREPRAQLEER